MTEAEQKQEQADFTIESERMELPKADLSKYHGTKATVALVEKRVGKHGPCVYVATDVLEHVGSDDSGFDLRASRFFGLVENEGKIGIGKDTLADKFLRRYGVGSFDELRGVDVVMIKKEKDGKDFLSIE